MCNYLSIELIVLSWIDTNHTLGPILLGFKNSGIYQGHHQMVHGKPILLLLALIVLQSSISVHGKRFALYGYLGRGAIMLFTITLKTPSLGLRVFVPLSPMTFLCMIAAAVFPALTPADFNGKNFVLFLTDQERDPLFFGKAWTDANLPGYNRLKKNGILFKRAFTNACMCTPARTTLLSGYMPAQHGAKYTLQANMPNTTFPQVDLPTPAQGIDNIATMATAAGYNFVFKGKLHVNKAAEPDFVWAPSDATSYGFTRWNTPDAGANQSFSEAGGAPAYNDDRFMFDTGATSEGHEGVLSFIKSTAAKKQPFFLVVSLVNPHDVLFYPTQFAQTYKNQSWLEGTLKLPATTFENITWPNKPKAQEQFNNIYSLGGAVKTPQARLEYLNFYGNLIKSSDAYLVNMLDAMDDAGLTDDTVVIRSADHGEMAMTHGGQRQKMFNMYEDSLRVPLIYSNPKLFPEPRESYALVSHVDFVPTMSTLMGTPAKSRKANWPGIDYSGIVMGARRGAQDYIVFTFDDYQVG